jgi:DNA invertase Pin-like site-specific DNA recombinase
MKNPNYSTVTNSDISRTFGYIRVSTREQNEARQVMALHDFGITDEHIFMDKLSGKDFNRPAYQELIHSLQPGDVLVIKSIDRLGRNYEEILDQWRIITKEKQAAIVVLDMPLLDTRSNRDLTGTLIADIVLQLLSYVAETERAFIRQRQAEGIAAAKARGQRFGPAPRDRGPEYPEIKAAWQRGEISATEAGRQLGCTHNTFLKWVRKDGAPQA